MSAAIRRWAGFSSSGQLGSGALPRLTYALCSLCALCACIPSALAQSTPFPDKGLEATVREVLHEPKETLTDEKLANVYTLESSGKGIRDLTGLEKCKNLAIETIEAKHFGRKADQRLD